MSQASSVPVFDTVDVHDLLDDVNQWLTLQAEEVSSLMAHLQEDHLSLLADLEKASPAQAVPAILPQDGDDSLNIPAVTQISTPSILPSRQFSMPSALPPSHSTMERPAPATPPPHTSRSSAMCKPGLHSFSTIDTVLAARQQRLSRWSRASPSQSPPRPPLFSSASDDVVSTPIGRPSLIREASVEASVENDAAVGMLQQHLRRKAVLQAGMDRWRCGVSEARQRHLSLPCSVDGRRAWLRLAINNAMRRLHSCAKQRSRDRRLLSDAHAHALDRCWQRWCESVERTAARHTLTARLCLISDERLKRTRLAGLFRWRDGVSAVFRVAEAAMAAQLHVRLRRTSAGLECWRAWLRRRAAWRRGAERRAMAHGGWTRQHLPCMRSFDGRAIFLEEGSAGMANAYRRRRTAAVVLCAWHAFTLLAHGKGRGERRADMVSSPSLGGDRGSLHSDDEEPDESLLSDGEWVLEQEADMRRL